MGACNAITTEIESPTDGRKHRVRIQFKYGDVWQYEYEVGDMIKWGGNDVGSHAYRKVVVDGCLEDVPPTDNFPVDYEVYITDNVIESVIPASGKWDFVRANDTCIIVDS